MTDEAEVLFERRGALGLITLNRPRALNALTHGMCLEMLAQLDKWARDPAIEVVAARGAGERAFCAGGDIRALYDSGKTGTSYARDFWHDEYRLDAAIKHFPKPYVALIRGIVMGGGVGVAVNGTYRVVDKSTTFAMPETGIGLFPDVGGSYFLSRCPGEIGMYLALTGARLKADDLYYSGIATDVDVSGETDIILAALERGESPGSLMSEITGGYIIERENAGQTPSPLEEHRDKIDVIFAAGSVEGILERLDRDGGDWAASTAATIRTKSPTSLKIAFRQLREGKKLEFDDCLRMEFRMVTRIIGGHDFYEGVRATILDKDTRPQWKPPSLAGVSEKDVAEYFAPLGDRELKL